MRATGDVVSLAAFAKGPCETETARSYGSSRYTKCGRIWCRSRGNEGLYVSQRNLPGTQAERQGLERSASTEKWVFVRPLWSADDAGFSQTTGNKGNVQSRATTTSTVPQRVGEVLFCHQNAKHSPPQPIATTSNMSLAR